MAHNVRPTNKVPGEDSDRIQMTWLSIQLRHAKRQQDFLKCLGLRNVNLRYGPVSIQGQTTLFAGPRILHDSANRLLEKV
jgi:hypothetical protein